MTWVRAGAGLLGLLAVLGCSADPAVEPTPPLPPVPTLDREAIRRIVDGQRERIPSMMEEDDLPGLAIALVDRDGPLWVEGFGYLTRDRERPVDERTIFSMQSTSKTITATATLVAVRDGLVDLDVSITEYYPDFTVNSRHESRAADKMTLRHLLGHRAGFTHEAPVGNNYVPEFESFEAHIESIRDTWLRYPVGLHHAYANLGVDLAGSILGRVSGKGFARYVQEAVLDPLGMEDSSYDWPTIRAQENRAAGYWSLVETMPLEHALIPSGGLYASARDMARYLRFQLNDGRVDRRELLSPALLRQMREPSFAAQGQDLGYGLGLRRHESHGRYFHHHAGAGFGFKSHMSWYPDLGVGIAVLSNSTDNNIVHHLANDVVGELFEISGLERPEGPRPFADLVAGEVDPAAGRRLLGTYRGRGSSRLLVTLDDGVLMAGFGGDPLPLRLISATEGFVEWEPGYRDLFRFVLEDGRPRYAFRVRQGRHYDFDEGPEGIPPGPDKPEWDAYLGNYDVIVVDKVAETAEIRRENGWLYLDQLRLVDEHLPGLFFTIRGEAVDLRGQPATWRNIPLIKK